MTAVDEARAALAAAKADRVAALASVSASIDRRREALGLAMATRADMIRGLIDEGITREEIAKACGVPSSTVYGWMNQHRTAVPQAVHR